MTVKAQVDTTVGKAKVTISKADGTSLFDEVVDINGGGKLSGLQILRGRGVGTASVDTIKVSDGIEWEYVPEEPEIPENAIAVSTVTNRIADECTVGTDNGDGTYTLDWWNYANFKGLKVTGDFDVTFKFKNNSAGVQNWHNFALAFCTNLARLNELNEGEDLYIRSDNFISAKFTGSTVIPACNWEWDNYKTIMNGATVKLNAKRAGTTIVVDAEISGSDGNTYHYMITAVDCPTDDMMVYLGGENCYLEVSEIACKNTADKEETTELSVYGCKDNVGTEAADVVYVTKEAKNSIDNTASTIGTDNGDGTYTLDWWNYANFKGLKVTGDFDVTFKFKNNSAGVQNWHNFALAFCTNLARLNELNEGEDLYIRSDNFISAKFTGSTVIPACNWEWDNYKTIMNGATVKLNAKRAGTTIVVDAEISGSDGNTYHYMITAVDCPTDDMMVYLGGENCYLEVSEVNVSTTTRTTVTQ